MSEYKNILADVKAKLDSVSNIGTVHDYSRLSSDVAKFLALFKYEPAGGKAHIRGWEITRSPTTEHIAGANFRHYVFKISGYMSLRDLDATEKTFQDLVEAICDKFRDASGGAAWDYRNGDDPEAAPIQVSVVEARMFGSVLCHYAEMQLSVTERILI